MAAEISGDVYFEIRTVGNVARVAAIHAPTNIEVVVVCPLHLTEFSMHQAALRKLRHVLEQSQKSPAPARGRWHGL